MARAELFDFAARWPEFWEAWSAPDTQAILEKDMRKWCAEHAYLKEDGTRPTWEPGDSLWNLSRTDYWNNKFTERANEIMAERNSDSYDAYLDEMKAEGKTVKVYDEDDLDSDEAYDEWSWGKWKIVFDEAMVELAPKPGTLPSLIMIHGGDFLNPALVHTAKKLFPGCRVTSRRRDTTGRKITIHTPNGKILFSLYDFYFNTYPES
jgi:hypothetical protein